jgi:hypothetical protein
MFSRKTHSNKQASAYEEQISAQLTQFKATIQIRQQGQGRYTYNSSAAQLDYC